MFYTNLQRGPGRKLSQGLASFAHGVLDQLAGKYQASCTLEMPASQRYLVTVLHEKHGLLGEPLEHVIDEALDGMRCGAGDEGGKKGVCVPVHHTHAADADLHIAVSLLEHAVNVDLDVELEKKRAVV